MSTTGAEQLARAVLAMTDEERAAFVAALQRLGDALMLVGKALGNVGRKAPR